MKLFKTIGIVIILIASLFTSYSLIFTETPQHDEEDYCHGLGYDVLNIYANPREDHIICCNRQYQNDVRINDRCYEIKQQVIT